MREFAEQEIIIPDGPFEGRRFRCERQPYTKLLYDEIERGQYTRIVITGPTQSGKSLSAFVLPTLFHLFEHKETVICGLPSMDMAADKWREDILPAIERSRYRDLLPNTGSGSRGGKVETIQFRHGVTLKFMSGGGGDKKRAGFTSRVLVITETDGMDEAGNASREADKITQMEGRTRAYGGRARIYMECTVSVEQGRTWQEYTKGTESKIILHCPLCKAWVYPEREHLLGHQDAETDIDAKENSRFYCPDCGEAWSEDHRRQANLDAKLIHRGQSIEKDGSIVGAPPRTDTLGFRWSAVNNLFVEAGDVGADEYKARTAANEDNAEKEMRQFVWALPYEPPIVDMTPLTVDGIASRLGDTAKGQVPLGTQYLTVGIDLRKRELHWVLLAWMPNGSSRVVAYGIEPVESDHLGVEKAILTALQNFRDVLLTGWPMGDVKRVPDQVWIDAGWMTDTVFAFIKESDQQKFRPTVGRGVGQYNTTPYSKPRSINSTVRYIGEEYHFALQAEKRVMLVEINADHWKGFTQGRLHTPVDQPGAMDLFRAPPLEHVPYGKQLVAEKQVQEFVAGKGEVTRWINEFKRPNHWGDATYLACTAGHFCGVRMVNPNLPEQPVVKQKPKTRLTMPDGRPFLLTER